MLAFAAESLATYRRLALVWQTACSLVLAAYGALMLGDTAAATRQATEAMDALAPIGDSWGLVHAQAMLGGIAQAEHRLDDAAGALGDAAEQSATARLHRPGGAPPRHARPRPAAGFAGATRPLATFDRAIAAALACGDGGWLPPPGSTSPGSTDRAATMPRRSPCSRRTSGGTARPGAATAPCSTAACLGAEKADPGSLQEVLTEAAAAGNAEVQVYALDALARCAAVQGDRARADELLASADSLAPTVTHLVDEADRFDKWRVHQDTTA